MVPERLEKGIKQEKQVLVVVLGVGLETKNINFKKLQPQYPSGTESDGGAGGVEVGGVGGGGLGGGGSADTHARKSLETGGKRY